MLQENSFAMANLILRKIQIRRIPTAQFFLCNILKVVVSSAAEAELGGLFLNCKEAACIRTTLEELGHPQPATPVQTDNSTAVGIVHDSIKQKRSKAMDMRFFWVRDRSKQGHYNVYWRSGKGNKADYYTKAHPVAHHRNVRPFYVFDKDNPEPYFDPNVNYYAPLDTDDDDDTVATAPETDSENESDTENQTVVASNCSQSTRPTRSAGEGVLVPRAKARPARARSRAPSTRPVPGPIVPAHLVLIILDSSQFITTQ